VLAAVASEWTDLFVASAGASAALAGLVFVAVSINVDRILGFQGLPERGLVTVLLLLNVVIVSLFGLVPGQSESTLGLELLVAGAVLCVVIGVLTARSRPADGEESHMVGAAVIAAMGTLPFLVGAVVLAAGSGDGLYWVFAGIVGALLGAVMNAWVLLVEILR
jgi:hypothetical protein